jgi:hypothetical protein
VNVWDDCGACRAGRKWPLEAGIGSCATVSDGAQTAMQDMTAAAKWETTNEKPGSVGDGAHMTKVGGEAAAGRARSPPCDAGSWSAASSTVVVVF